MRRASVETIERMVTSKADQARGRRVSLTIMNCIWARNTEQETSHPVHGEVMGKFLIVISSVAPEHARARKMPVRSQFLMLEHA